MWTKNFPFLKEGQFIKVVSTIHTKSSFTKETSVTNASVSAKIGTMYDVSRRDIHPQPGWVGIIMSARSSTDGSYMVRFGYELMNPDPKMKPNGSFCGNGLIVKLHDKDLLFNVEVWVE